MDQSDPKKQQKQIQLTTLHSKQYFEYSDTPELMTLQDKVSIVFPGFSISSITFVLTLVNTFMWINVWNARENRSWECTVYLFQSKCQPSITYNFQIWRLVTSSIVFKTWIMYSYNNLTLNMIGHANERENRVRFVILFYSCIIAGNLMSCIYQNPEFLSAGTASGTIGLLPTQIYRFIKIRRLPIAKRRIVLLTVNFIIMFSLNLEGFMGVNNVDWIAHIAAITVGFVFGTYFQDFEVFPSAIKKHKYLIKKILLSITVVLFACLVSWVFIVLRIRNYGRSQINYYASLCRYQ